MRYTVTKLKELFPEIDPTSLEANLMLERSHRLLADQRESHWARYGLTGRRFILLRLLYTSHRKHLSMSEIATEMHLGMNNVTQLVSWLVRDGLIERVTASEDKRVVHAVLTLKGEQMFTAVFPENIDRIEEDERKVLIHLLSRLRLHLLAGQVKLD